METTRTESWRERAENRYTAPLLRLLTPNVLKFFRFALVGGSGVAVNMLTLWLLHDELGFPLSRSSVVAISLAILNNFLWNNFWTFGESGIQARRLAQFIVISLVGMAINLAILNIFFALGVHYALGNLAGIGVATAWNFFANARWTWGAKRAA